MTYFFHCTACGKCCNSPPRLSLPELFRYQDIFIGSLALTRLGTGGDPERAALLDAIAFRVPAQGGATHFAILPQGYEYPGASRCPALDHSGLCSLQLRGKPAQCRAVPLDPLATNARQVNVLEERMADAVWHDAGCIARAPGPHHARLVQGAELADPDYVASVGQWRAAAADDRRIWGMAVWAHMRADWAATEAALARSHCGYAAIAVVPPVLMLAGLSDALRQRCIAYVHAQIRLIDRAVDQALLRRQPGERPTTHMLRAWMDTYQTVLRAIAQPVGGAAPDVEAWLGIDDETPYRATQSATAAPGQTRTSQA